MAFNSSIKSYRQWYVRLISLYPKPYRQRFGESLVQTFTDLLLERATAHRTIFSCAAWMFVDTLGGIIKENITFMTMQTITKRLIVWAVAIALLLTIPLTLTLTGSGVDGEGFHWTLFDFVIVAVALLAVAVAYELIGRRLGKTTYRLAFGLGLLTALMLFWVNGAVGIIGSENNDANLLYFAVFAVGFLGSIIARFKPRGMALTLFAAAIVQLAIPVIVLIVWPEISWGEAGVVRIFILNAFFAMLFVGSGLLFRQADKE